MAVFEYTALNASSRKVKGLIDADSLRSARGKLRQQGLFPTAINETRQKLALPQQKNSSGDLIPEQVGILERLRTRSVGGMQLAMATRQLATLVGSGMPLVDSLRALGELIDHAGLKRVVAEVSDRVNEGSDLAEAMRHYPRIFSRLYVNMIASGQANGRLDLVLDRLADLLESQAGLRRKIISAITYPVLMLLLCCGVIMILLAYVVPQITAIFRDQGATLPLPTRIIIAASDFLQGYWWVLLAMIALVCLLVTRHIQTEKGRVHFDSLKLRFPLFGPLTLKVATSRFARNLGTLLASDVPLLEALRIVKNILNNVLLESAVDGAIEGVREGRSLSKELGKSNLFPRMLIHMTAAGEQSGEKLSQMLLRAAASYEAEVNAVVSALTSILEPVLIVFLAMVVGAILASVMLPMLEMNSLAVR